MANPVIATMKCKDCDAVSTVHQVARGRGRRLMFYTNCPACGCDQRTGKGVQQYIFNHASARVGYEEIFEGQEPPAFRAENKTETALDEQIEETNKNNDLIDDNDQEARSKKGLLVLGLVLTSVLAIVGLKK